MAFLTSAQTALFWLATAGLLADRGDVHLSSPSGPPAIPVGRVQPVGSGVEVFSSGKWKEATAGTSVRTGDRIRTGEAGAAELDLAWASLLLGSSSALTILPSRLLTTLLEQGRLEEHALAHDIIRLRTPEATVRGSGHVVVRRSGERTSVSAFSGNFRVENAQGAVTVAAGRGVVVESGQAPKNVVALPPSVRGAYPVGDDPVYVVRGTPASARWTSSMPRHHLQLRVIPTDDVVFDGDVSGLEYQSSTPPIGLYRWQIFAVDDNGLESAPVYSGVLCVVDK